MLRNESIDWFGLYNYDYYCMDDVITAGKMKHKTL